MEKNGGFGRSAIDIPSVLSIMENLTIILLREYRYSLDLIVANVIVWGARE